VHSLEQLYYLIESTFHHFDPETLDKKMLIEWKTPQESPMNFWDRLYVLQFQSLKNQMKFQYVMENFEYCLTKSVNPKKKFKLKPYSTYFGDGAA